jgi:hypothetical protein
MSAKLLSVSGQEVKIEVTIELDRSMLKTEERIQKSLNEAGCLASMEALNYFDTDGSPIEVGGELWRTKGQQPKAYQTPYGEVSIDRHVYQRSGGGKTYCPLEREARIVVTSTPRFAKQVSSKMASGPAREVQRDWLDNHGRSVAVSYLQRLSEAVASVAQAKEEAWSYAPPPLESAVSTVSIGLDGTCMLLCEDGWREAMAGTVSLYDTEGERQHTIYIGATPEYGKSRFLERLEREVQRTKQAYPGATYVGIADGAEANWRFLEQHTRVQILDFYHAVGYLGAAASAAHPHDTAQRELWLSERCHQLKHAPGAAETLYREMVQLQKRSGLTKTVREQLDAAVTYYYNHKHQMNYAQYRENHYPIGSGVTEAACKTLVKQRLCNSGMRWKEKGAAMILSLRALVLTPTRWTQFWNKLDQYGFPVAV